MTLPKRPHQHVIDDLATDALCSAIHKLGWVFRRLPADYGLDAEIEVRGAECQMTGALARAQVKGMWSASARADGVDVKVRTVRYWLVSPIPVFLVCVVLPSRRILVKDPESYLVENHKLDYIQNTSRKMFRFRLTGFTPLLEFAHTLKDWAIEHQETVQDAKNYTLYNPASQLIACIRLIYHFDGDITALLKDLRENGSDERLKYDYGYYVFLKERLRKCPDYIREIKSFVNSCASPALITSAKQARSAVRRDEASVPEQKLT